MPAATFNFVGKYRIEQGVYREQPFIWKDSNGVAVNLTGYTARMELRRSVTAADVLLSLTNVNGGISIDPLLGKVIVIFKESDTQGVPWTGGVYDLELVNPSGKPMRFIEGEFEVSKEVTR